ncbi:MAG: hypothetical protein ACRDGQ_00005, partial [Candidatus Limnocylindrales bacterium]
AVAVVTSLGASVDALKATAREVPPTGQLVAGLTDDAKAVIEAAVNRALVRGRGPGIADLLVGLAVTDCPARAVLAAHGIHEEQLIGLFGGDPQPT